MMCPAKIQKLNFSLQRARQTIIVSIMRRHVSVFFAAETRLRFSNHFTATKNDNLAERIIQVSIKKSTSISIASYACTALLKRMPLVYKGMRSGSACSRSAVPSHSRTYTKHCTQKSMARASQPPSQPARPPARRLPARHGRAAQQPARRHVAKLFLPHSLTKSCTQTWPICDTPLLILLNMLA